MQRWELIDVLREHLPQLIKEASGETYTCQIPMELNGASQIVITDQDYFLTLEIRDSNEGKDG